MPYTCLQATKSELVHFARGTCNLHRSNPKAAVGWVNHNVDKRGF